MLLHEKVLNKYTQKILYHIVHIVHIGNKFVKIVTCKKNTLHFFEFVV